MNYGEIITNDTANGPGIRLSLFVSGCTNHCKGCFNEKTWNFNYGKPFTDITLNCIFKELANPWYDGITILGGEPMHEKNVATVAAIVNKIKNTFPEKNIWVYTGYTIEDLLNKNNRNIQYVLSNIDVLVDGPFIEEEKDLTIPFRGSRNQRIITNCKDLLKKSEL